MRIPIDEVVYFGGTTRNPTTGAISDADSTPTFEVFEEATDTDIGVGGNMTKRTSKTGVYRGSFTASAANGFEAGKWYHVVMSATVGSIADSAIVLIFMCAPAESSAGVPKVDTSHVAGTAQTAGDIKASITALNNISAAQVNAEVVDALATDTYAEPGQGAPGATIALSAKINYLYKAWRNRSTMTASEYALYADNATTKDHEATFSDNGTTADRGEVGTGA